MLQFDMSTTYIKGEDSTAADVLSRVPLNSFPTEQSAPLLTKANVWGCDNIVGAVLEITTDKSVLDAIWGAYKDDNFVQKLLKSAVQGALVINGLITWVRD